MRRLGFAAVVLLSGCAVDPVAQSMDDPGTEDPVEEEEEDGPDTVTFRTFLGATPTNVTFLAAHDGDGAWQVVSGNAGVYSFAVSSGRFGVAAICATSSSSALRIREQTIDEGTELRIRCDAPAQSATAEVSGVISGLASGQHAEVEGGPMHNGSWIYSGERYTHSLPEGTWDVGIIRVDDATQAADRILFLRNEAFVGERSLDANLSSGLPLASRSITVIGGRDGEQINSNSTFHLSRGGWLSLRAPAKTELRVVPSSMLAGNDLHAINASAWSTSAPEFRSVEVLVREPGNMTIELPDPFVAAAARVATAPALFRVTFPDVHADLYTFLFLQDTGISFLQFTVHVTRGWIVAAAQHDYSFPDLSSLPGWNAAWGAQPALSATFNGSASSTNRGVRGALAALEKDPLGPPTPDAEGLQVSTAGNMSMVMP
jgi:hypothetical protein